jgi:hypothetical protein
MGSIRQSVVFGVLLALIFSLSPVAAPAEDSELFINRVWPNVLLMVDKSGSMSMNGSGSTNIGNLDSDGTSNTRLDALWKVTYTLLNADLSIPPGGGGTPSTVSCEVREYNGDDSIKSGTSVSNLRYRDCKGGTLPSSGQISISRRGRIDTVTYTSKGTCPGGHGTCLFFSPSVTFTYDHSKGESLRYTGTTTGYWFTLPYPSPASKSGTGGPSNEHAQAIGATYYAGNLTSADEAQLKARIGYMDFTGSLSPYAPNINIRNQIPSTALDQTPFSSPIRYSDIWNSVIAYANTNASPDIYTPTAQALVTAKTFFQNAYSSSATCRPNYAILITDGEDTMGLNSTEDGTTSSPNDAGQRTRHNRVIEKAAALWDNTYKISLFTVGVGIGVPGDSDAYKRESREVLRRAADQLNEQLTSSQVAYVNTNGDNVLKGAGSGMGYGKAFFATDATQLSVALGSIFDSILEGNYVFTSPTVSSVRTADRNYLFLGTFQPEQPPATLWEGHLYSYSINGVDNLTLRWDTNDLLDNTTATNRKMYSASVSGTTWTRLNFGTNTGFGGTNGIDNNMLAVANDTARDNVISYVRGTSRSLKLGDIYHSKPVLVGEPSPYFIDSGYSTGVGGTSFYDTYRTRKRVLYAGANDGTLHAFLAGSWTGSTYDHGTGAERFAYLPKLLLPTIKNFVPTSTSSHRYWVDSSPRVADVWLPTDNTDSTKDSSEWRTVLVTGLRSGGSGYFALDVTDPDASNYPKVMWEYQNPAILADSWSEPYIAKVKIRNQATGDTEVRDRWVAIFGGGMSDSGDVGKTLIVMDLATGAPLKVFGPTGIDNEIVASPTPVLDGNGYIRYIYVPDLSGNLYRFDLQSVGTKNTGLSEWSFYKVFQPATAGRQPAFHRAETGAVTDSLRYVFFGTGNQEYPISDGGSGKFYAIRNVDTDNTTVQETSLTDMTSSLDSTSGAVASGWKIDLGSIGTTSVDTASHAGEKVLSDPVVFNGVVYFTTYAANSTSPCTSGGTSRLYGLGYQTGLAALAPVTGETPESGNTMVSRHVYTTLGVASSPTLSINPSGVSSLFIGFSGVAGGTGSVKEIQVESPAQYKSIKSWKEML